MIYRVFKGYDTGGEPIYEWGCDCEECRTTSSLCMAVIEMKEEEKNKPRNTAIYAGLRR